MSKPRKQAPDWFKSMLSYVGFPYVRYVGKLGTCEKWKDENGYLYLIDPEARKVVNVQKER